MVSPYEAIYDLLRQAIAPDVVSDTYITYCIKEVRRLIKENPQTDNPYISKHITLLELCEYVMSSDNYPRLYDADRAAFHLSKQRRPPA